MEETAIVKLQERRSRTTVQYLVTVPKDIVAELGLKKGQPLLVRVIEIEKDGRKKRVIVYEPIEV